MFDSSNVSSTSKKASVTQANREVEILKNVGVAVIHQKWASLAHRPVSASFHKALQPPPDWIAVDAPHPTL